MRLHPPIGSLVRAGLLLVAFWIVAVGPRAYPSVVAARDADSLPRAALTVEEDGCERDSADDLLWRCEATGTLVGGGEFHWRRASLAYERRGEEPASRHALGSAVDVAVVREPFGAGVKLLPADRVAAEATAEVRWLARQPLVSLAVAVAGWWGLVIAARLRRRRFTGALELTTWPGLPGLALALLGLAVAVGAAWFERLPLVVGVQGMLLLLVPVAPALLRTFIVIDRGAGQLRAGQEVGPWCRLDAGVPFSQVAEVRLHDALHLPGVPAWPQWRLALEGIQRSWPIGTGHPRRVQRMAATLSAYLGVPMSLPHEPGRVPTTLTVGRRTGADAEPDEDAGERDDSDEQWPAVPIDEPSNAPGPEPAASRPPSVGERLRRLPRAMAGVLLILLALLGVAVFNSGGVDPFLARVLEPEVAGWPAGAVIRRVAVAAVPWRATDARTLHVLARLAHTLEPGHALWAPVMRAAGRVLGEDLPAGDPAVALARLDAAAARVLDRPPGPLGVLGWQPLDPYWVEWLDGLAGPDEALAIERFNGLVPPRGLPTPEWYLAWVGRAFADARPIGFVVVAADGPEGWRPRAVPRAAAEGVRRLEVDTVGEALAIVFATYREHRPPSPPADVAAWWAPVAAARRLPAVASVPARP